MKSINRTAVIVHPRLPYIEWTRGVDDEAAKFTVDTFMLKNVKKLSLIKAAAGGKAITVQMLLGMLEAQVRAFAVRVLDTSAYGCHSRRSGPTVSHLLSLDGGRREGR